MRHKTISILPAIWLAAALPVCAGCLDAQPWPEADRLFRGDPHWVGGDGAFSVALGGGRTLWLFGDSWIDPSGQRSRDHGHMVRNSAAIQTGTDPATASIEFHWDDTDRSHPGAAFGFDGDGWYWPGHGVRLGDRLLMFLNEMRSTDADLGFASTGWRALLIENPDDDFPQWHTVPVQLPPRVGTVPYGFAGVLVHAGHVYAFGAPDDDKSQPIHAVRWTIDDAHDGRLDRVEFLGRIFGDAQSELTIHFDTASNEFVAVHTVGFGSADLAIRTAAALAGPWSEPVPVYRPPEFGQDDIMIYAGKAHPQLGGAQLVLTYATNSFRFEDQIEHADIYYPRFVRANECTPTDY